MNQGSVTPNSFVAHELDVLDGFQQECYVATSGLMSRGNRGNPLYQPVLDQEHIAQGGSKPLWPGGAAFAVCLTHDVDHVSGLSPRIHWRRLLASMRDTAKGAGPRARRTLQASLMKLGRSLVSWGKADPLHCYERWLQIEQQVNAKSTFLFLPDRYHQNHYSNGGYRHGDRIQFDGNSCTVAEMMREIHARGFEVGLHASWWSFNDADEMKRQKSQIEVAIDAQVCSVRHHNLHFDVRRTPQVHEQAGLTIDSSMGFNDNIGFRTGTAYPHRWHDPRTGRALNVLELPLVMQDKGLLKFLGAGSLALATEWAESIVDRVAQVGGVLTVLWHPSLVVHQEYMKLYQVLLQILSARGAWFGTMGEIDRCWREQHDIRTEDAA